MAAERAGLYGSVADLVVDTDGRDADTVAEAVLDELDRRRLNDVERLNEGDRCYGPRTTRRERRSASTASGTSRPIRTGSGATRAGGAPRCPGPGPCPVPSSYNDVLVGQRSPRPRRRRLVPAHRLRARGVGRARGSSCVSTRPRTVPVVWVDDTLVAEHEGGYTPFEADVTALVDPGAPIRLTVVVNNELTWRSLPPGIVEEMPDGRRRQRQYHDFFNYAGLSPWRVAVLDAAVAHRGRDGDHRARGRDRDRRTARTAVVDGQAATAVRVELRDADGGRRGRGTGDEGELRVADAAPVAPGQRLSLRAPGRPRWTGTT